MNWICGFKRWPGLSFGRTKSILMARAADALQFNLNRHRYIVGCAFQWIYITKYGNKHNIILLFEFLLSDRSCIITIIMFILFSITAPKKINCGKQSTHYLCWWKFYTAEYSADVIVVLLAQLAPNKQKTTCVIIFCLITSSILLRFISKWNTTIERNASIARYASLR